VVRGLDFLAMRCDVMPNRLGVYGFSYGSSLVAHVAPGEPRIKALVLAGIFPSAREQTEYAYNSLGPLTVWPGIWGAQWDGLRLDSLRPHDVIARVAPIPTLFVSGSADTVVPPAMTLEVFERAGEPKLLLAVAGAGHGDYGSVPGEAYFARLVKFFDRYLRTAAQAEKPQAPERARPCTQPGRPLRPT
jgi:fermentation-respiration switch protein FrsA (DUF1100 family)